GWAPLALTNMTNVALIGECKATLVANATPAASIAGFVNSMVALAGCMNCTVTGIHFDASQHSPAYTTALSALGCTECLFDRLEGIGFTGNATFAEAACAASTWSR